MLLLCFTYLRKKIGRDVALYIMAITVPHKAVYSGKINTVRYAAEWCSKKEYLKNAFRKSVIAKNEQVSRYLYNMVENETKDVYSQYFMFKNNFRAPDNVRDCIILALQYLDIEMMLKFEMPLSSFITRFPLEKIMPVLNKIRIDWQAVMIAGGTSEEFRLLLEIILPLADPKIFLEMDREIYFRSIGITKVLLQYHVPKFNQKDAKNFKSNRDLAILCINMNLIPDLRDVFVELITKNKITLKEIPNVFENMRIFTKSHNQKIMNHIENVGVEIFEIIIQKNLMYRSINLIFKEIYRSTTYVEILQKYYKIDLFEELELIQLRNKKLITYYFDYIDHEKYRETLVCIPELNEKIKPKLIAFKTELNLFPVREAQYIWENTF